MDYLEQYHYNQGYELWPFNDANFPAPIQNDIQVVTSSETLVRVECTVIFPAAIPFQKVIQERSVGIAHSWRFAVAVVASRIAGRVRSQIVCTARHLKWFEEHNETEVGGEQVFLINSNDLVVGRSVEDTKDIAHGPVHFDRVSSSPMLLDGGEVFLTLIGIHQTWGTIGVPNAPRISPPGGSSPPSVTPPTGSDPRPDTPHRIPAPDESPKPSGVAMKLPANKQFKSNFGIAAKSKGRLKRR